MPDLTTFDAIGIGMLLGASLVLLIACLFDRNGKGGKAA